MIKFIDEEILTYIPTYLRTLYEDIPFIVPFLYLLESTYMCFLGSVYYWSGLSNRGALAYTVTLKA